MIHLFAPLQPLNGAAYWKAIPPAQLQEWAPFSIRWYELADSINLTVFGAECLVTGYLIHKSTFPPKILGASRAVGGVCYLINSFVNFMPPNFADFLFPYILLPCLVAELALALWLTIIGVNNKRWYALVDHRWRARRRDSLQRTCSMHSAR